MSKKDKTTELEDKKKKKEKSALRKTTEFIAETGLWIGAGTLVGIANYFYDFP